MTDKNLLDFPEAYQVNLEDYLHISQGGADKKILAKLTPMVNPAIVFRGEWLPNVQYLPNDLVTHDSIVWLCKTQNTSSNFPFENGSTAFVVYQGVTKRQQYSKRISVIGSNVSFGNEGTYNNGFIQNLATILSGSPRYYSISNASIEGNTTTEMIVRFHKDILPTDPDIVIICISLSEQGLQSASSGVAKKAIYDWYIKDIIQLAAMVRQIGAEPVIMGEIPNNNYTVEDYGYVKQAISLFEASDFHYVNTLACLDDFSGGYVNSVLHGSEHTDKEWPSTDGHGVILSSIPLELFDKVLFGNDKHIHDPKIKSKYVVGSGTSGLVSSYKSTSSGYGLSKDSLTVMFDVRRPEGITDNKTILSIATATSDTTNLVSIKNATNYWEVLDNTDSPLVSGSIRPSNDNKTANICLTLNNYANEVRFYIDGQYMGSGTPAIPPLGVIYFGGRPDSFTTNAVGYEISNIKIWRTTFNEDQVMDAYLGNTPKANLCLYSPAILNGSSRLINLAKSDTYLELIQTNGTILTDTKDPQTSNLIFITSSTYTPSVANIDSITKITHATGCTVTVNTGIAAIGAKMEFRQGGAGALTFTAGSNVTLTAPTGLTAVSVRQGDLVTLYLESYSGATENWVIYGALAP